MMAATVGDPRDWTLRNALDRQAKAHGDKLFLHYVPDGRSYTYREVRAAAIHLEHAWAQQGITRGSHVALFMDNCPEFVLTMLALGRMGAVCVPVNTAARGKLLAYYLELADITAMVVQEKYLDVVSDAARAHTPLRGAIVVGERGSSSAVPAKATPGPALHSFPSENLLRRQPAFLPDAPPPAFTDLACLLFTSGTTGPSKASMWTQAGVHFYAADNARCREVGEDDVEFICLPLFHVNAMLHSMLTAFMAGASVALADRFSASGFWDSVRRSGATRFNAIGAIANFLWSREPSSGDRDHKVRLCSLAPVPQFVHGFEERFGLKVFTGYGLSDYGLATAGGPDDPPEKIMGCGRPRAGVELRIVDEDDLDVPVGTPGEIVFRHAQMWGTATGYYKMPQQTLSSRRNLWFHTGDRGYLDEDGYLFFTDRLKDAIRRRGENISAFEVESIITAHPAVQQVAAYPVKAELSEDEVAVSVVLHPGATLTQAQLVDHCRRNMSRFMVPRFVEFVAQLPMTANQKVEKYKLRARAESDLAAFWDGEAA